MSYTLPIVLSVAGRWWFLPSVILDAVNEASMRQRDSPPRKSPVTAGLGQQFAHHDYALLVGMWDCQHLPIPTTRKWHIVLLIAEETALFPNQREPLHLKAVYLLPDLFKDGVLRIHVGPFWMPKAH
jgi:hypothetical protein